MQLNPLNYLKQEMHGLHSFCDNNNYKHRRLKSENKPNYHHECDSLLGELVATTIDPGAKETIEARPNK